MTQEGYGEAYGQGFKRTVGLLRSRGASRDHAEDVAQAAWLRGWQKLDQLRDEGMIVSWVNTIAINYYRRGSRVEARYQPLGEAGGNVEIDLAAIDAAKILKLCGPGDRALFEQQMCGLSIGEIAGRYGASPVAIRIRLWRARQVVRARVKRDSMPSSDLSRSVP